MMHFALLTVVVNFFLHICIYNYRGPPALQASLIFFSNAPYSSRPCTGSFVINPTHRLAAETIKVWWDHNISSKNFVHEVSL